MTTLLIILGLALLAYLVVAAVLYFMVLRGDGEMNVLQQSLLPMLALGVLLWPLLLVWFLYTWVRDHLPWR